MLFLRNPRLAVAPLLVLLSGGRDAHADSSPAATSTTADATKTRLSAPTVQPTCESRTVNYITHTLPQQCLTSPPTVSPTSSESNVIVSTTASAAGGATAGDAAASVPAEEHELDSDGNDLSTGAFMSFEEWKEMMLKRSGQDAFEDRPRKSHDGRGDVPGQDFGSMGEEGEISLDFDAYSDKISEITSAGKPSPEEVPREDAVEKVTYDENPIQIYRSKDAGKTCKERFSYSSFDAGATVLKTSPGAKNPKAILVENKDSYMLMECGTKNKFFIVELSDDVRVDTVVLANFEFFSSMVRQFRVSVSDRYPVKLDKWKVLGEFTARNSRDIQPFLVEHPQIWARYIRVEVLSHYGKEFYCPLSLLRVHGTRMLDSWRETDLNDAESELEEEEDLAKSIETPDDSIELVETIEIVVDDHEVEEAVLVENKTTETLQSDVNPSYWDPSYFHYRFVPDSTCGPDEQPPKPSQTSPGKEQDHQAAPAMPKAAATAEESGKTTSSPINGESSSGTTATETTTTQAHVASGTTHERPGTAPTNVTSAPTNATIPTLTSESSQIIAGKSSSDASSKSTTTHVTHKVRPSASTSLKHPSSKTPTPKVVTGTTPRNKTATATSSSGSASPTVQDSFFKHVTKRLQNLETNTTLSMQYIESQSRFLQEALAKLERRHALKVDLFLDSLNKTVMTELRELRSQYDQHWQSTIIALESQREKQENDNIALSTRVGLLADEMVFQKRMAIVQSVLLLGCIMLVIFSRGITHAGLELYYPTHLQESFSRFASPLSPGGRRAAQHNQSSVRESVEDTDAAAANRGLVSDSDTNNTPPRPRVGRNPTSELRPSAQHHLAVPKTRRPSPTRTVSETTGMAFYQPPTPASLDAGYDSEPSQMPSSPKPDYFSSRQDEEYADNIESNIENTQVGTTPSLSDNDQSSRLSTPALEADEMVDESELQSRSTTRIPMSSAAGIKPLPALPEDSD
ncbi:hypothetical protein PFICI_12939 [Pestalotiopsis fici W106-1]|uniref:SUN domain-containing protein n=1 Tax=Pestalotiopsis fici (strain W106-1 / CGMCC3.15140) TaxID=1229662 RepID=W3WQ27_PESFW|nr:uncharacterized protein PFICI_12939 [Pestalotiopsis fici W106-1]ETS75995.1 hypothetical protein PFICI_12939 [Pestalotiopsis fici W106-1]